MPSSPRVLAAALAASVALAACGSASVSSVSATTTNSEAASPDTPANEEPGVSETTPAAGSGAPQAAATIHETVTIDGTELEYAVFTPDDYRAGETRPLLLFVPPGPQTADIRDQFLASNFVPEATKRGWVVVSPSAPGGVLFFQGSEAVIPEFLDLMTEQYPPEGGRIHLVGMSNGGISSFRIAVAQPERFASVIVAPGFPRDGDEDNLDTLTGIPVVLFVGENDGADWVSAAETTAARLNELGGDVTLSIEPDSGHFPERLSDGIVIFDLLDSYR